MSWSGQSGRIPYGVRPPDRTKPMNEMENMKRKKEKRTDAAASAATSECGNCEWKGRPTIELQAVPDLAQRLDPGSVVPSGECPKCGALCYLQKPRGNAALPAAKAVIEIKGGCLQTVYATVPLAVVLRDWDNIKEIDAELDPLKSADLTKSSEYREVYP
jgi:hypothetical protein